MSVLPHADPRPVGLRFSAPACGLGALASVLQILLLRESAAQFSGNELTYGFVFAAWLLWGGAGSLWASRREITAAGLARLFQAVLVLTPVGFLGLRLARPALGLTPGELVSPGLILTATLVLTFFLSAPLGAAFAFAAKLDGPATRTYVWESAGAAGGGLLAYLVLIPLFSNAVAAALWGTVAALFVFAAFGRPRPVMGTAAALAALAALAFLDGPSQRLAWRPFDLVRAEDSRYGRLQVIRTSEQVTLYDHGQKGFSYPDPAAAEEAVHFALLQRPRAGRILLIGGGAGGSLAEILKYPGTTVDYVELDPAVIGLADRFLPEAARASLHHSRVRLHFADGRAFLERIAGTYDAIIVDLPPPATAQLNRYYSLEFFRLVRKRLNPSGIFSFRVPSSEEYISPTLRSFLAMLEATLGAVFPEVRAVPGGTNIFLASDGPLTIEASLLGEEAKRLGIRTATTNPAVLAALRHLLVDDAAAGRHPLDVARSDDALVAQAVAVIGAAADHVGDRFDAAVGVPGESGQVFVRVVLAEVVEHEEGIEHRDFPEAEAAAEVDPRPLERGQTDEDLPDAAGLVHVVRLPAYSITADLPARAG